MTWHLKDESLEKKLIELCPEFISYLQVAVEKKCPCDDGVCVGFLRHDRGKPYGNDLWFWISELVKVKEYDPDDWNEYPAVTPPEGVIMRIELKDGLKLGGYFKHFEDGDYWCNANGTVMPKSYSRDVVRFRPWDGA